MKIELVTGDDNAVQIACVKNGDPLVIDMAATVRALLISEQAEVTVGPVTCSNAAAGANWPTGIVAIEFPAALSATMPVGPAAIEIEISQGGKLQTYFARHVQVVKGHLV